MIYGRSRKTAEGAVAMANDGKHNRLSCTKTNSFTFQRVLLLLQRLLLLKVVLPLQICAAHPSHFCSCVVFMYSSPVRLNKSMYCVPSEANLLLVPYRASFGTIFCISCDQIVLRGIYHKNDKLLPADENRSLA